MTVDKSEFVEIFTTPGRYKIDLRYATPHNFTGANVYGRFNRALLHRRAAAQLDQALAYLHRTHPQYSFVIFDALRPRSAQWILWNHVKGTAQQDYVADPTRGSVHNYGLAVDLSILDEQGRELDMGTPFDDFTPLSQPQLEERHLHEGKLTDLHLRNRLLLRSAMAQGGYRPIVNEWWHFEAAPRELIRDQYKIVESEEEIL
jgi:D-alanyl-D-alanine dipeptidase